MEGQAFPNRADHIWGKNAPKVLSVDLVAMVSETGNMTC